MLGNKPCTMIRHLLTVCLFALATSASAQTPTQRLERRVGGQGVVTITQDQRLTNLIDGFQPVLQETEVSDDEFSVQTVLRKKARGYRVQVFWGNARRSDQQRAQHMGEQVTALFPELQAYTTFDSPHWRCRVGDFTTRAEAAKYLKRLRRISPDAMIVQSEIYVYQEK